MLRRTFTRIARLFYKSTVATSSGTPEVDLSWFAEVASSVFADERRGAASTCGEITPFLGAFHRDVMVVTDAERGSLLLTFPCGSSWRFAVEDVEPAAQLAAGCRLGGLLVRLTFAGEGLVRIHGVWGRLSYVVHGLPVRDVLSRG
jgi:hypothetical protein